MGAVLVEWNGVGDFDGHLPDLHVNVRGLQQSHELLIKIGDRTRGERDGFLDSVAGFEDEAVLQEVEPDLEGTIAIRDLGRGEAASAYVQRDIPPVVDERGMS